MLAAERVDNLDRLGELVRDFVGYPRPLYLDVEVPHMVDYTPPVSAWLKSLAGNASRPVH